MRKFILEVNLTQYRGGGFIFVYHLVDANLGAEKFLEKDW